MYYVTVMSFHSQSSSSAAAMKDASLDDSYKDDKSEFSGRIKVSYFDDCDTFP